MTGRTQDSSSIDGRYKFTGKERDSETQYDYFGARYYDARIGRWLQVDPLGGKYPSISPYVYCANMPLKFFDSDGKEIKDTKYGVRIKPETAWEFTIIAMQNYFNSKFGGEPQNDAGLDFYSYGSNILKLDGNYDLGNLSGQDLYLGQMAGVERNDQVHIFTGKKEFDRKIARHSFTTSLRTMKKEVPALIFQNAENRLLLQITYESIDELNKIISPTGWAFNEKEGRFVKITTNMEEKDIDIEESKNN